MAQKSPSRLEYSQLCDGFAFFAIHPMNSARDGALIPLGACHFNERTHSCNPSLILPAHNGSSCLKPELASEPTFRLLKEVALILLFSCTLVAIQKTSHAIISAIALPPPRDQPTPDV